MSFSKLSFITLILISFVSYSAVSQITDTIANWDGTNVDWTISGPDSEAVENPQQDGINLSLNCLKITTRDNPYDLIK